MKEVLTLESLTKLDSGKIPAQFDALMQSAIRDVQDRPADRKPRRVCLMIDVSPSDADGDTAAFSFSMKSTVPAHKSRSYEAVIKNVGGAKVGLLFNAESPDDVDQLTLDEAAKKVS